MALDSASDALPHAGATDGDPEALAAPDCRD